MDSLSYRLRSAREKAGLHQSQLARALNVRPSAVSHWETGRRIPPTEQLVRIAEITLSDPAYLLSLPRPKVTLHTDIIVPQKTRRGLTDDEKKVIAYWRSLSDRQRQNFLKLLGVSVRVIGKGQR